MRIRFYSPHGLRHVRTASGRNFNFYGGTFMAFSALWTEHGFWCIQEGGVRAFLIEGREKAVLIDTTRERGLYEFCRTITDKPIMVVLTHSDPDHISSNCEFEEIYLNPADYAYYKTKADFLPQIHPIWEGDIIDLGNYIFEVFSIPGHTPGSIFLLERNRRFAIGGDSVQTGPIFMFGPGRDMNAFIASMEKLMPYIAAMDTIYSSHNELLINPMQIHALHDGAISYLNGEAEYSEPDKELPENIKLCTVGRANFYAEYIAPAEQDGE